MAGIMKVDIEEELAGNFHRVKNPIHLKFENLNASAGEKKLLQDVSGEAKPGEVLAIMGPSGAGKSTLLNFVSGRSKNLKLDSGQVTLNNQVITEESKKKIGYVLQQEIFFSHLTVRQSLNFVGEVRISDDFKKSEKHDIVNGVIDELGLRKCADTVLGGGMFTVGVSGGEKKRTSVGVELITNPTVLIMDEPTTGLDSATARSLIQSVKTLAQNTNRTVVTTIHQPSSQVFHLFDKLLLLCNGRIAYFGKTSGVLRFFEYLGMPCHPNWNPADYLMDQLSADEETQEKIVEGYKEFSSDPSTRDICFGEAADSKDGGNAPDEQSRQDIVDIGDSFEASSTERLLRKDYTGTVVVSRYGKPKAYPTGVITQTAALSKRAFVQAKKELWDGQSFLQTLFIAIAIGLLWFNTPYTEDSLKNRRGAMFYVLLYLLMIPQFNALMSFPVERGTIAKERDDGMYRLSAYFISKCLSELPVLLFQPVLFYTIVYWMVGLNRSVWFLVGVAAIITCSILGQTYGLCIGAAITNFKHALTFSIIISQAAVLIAGFFIKHIPIWLSWGKYLSHVTYAFNIMLRMEFEYAVKTFKCANVSAYSVCYSNQTDRRIPGPMISKKMQPVNLNIGESFAVLWGIIIFFRIVLYFLLKYRNKPF